MNIHPIGSLPSKRGTSSFICGRELLGGVGDEGIGVRATRGSSRESILAFMSCWAWERAVWFCESEWWLCVSLAMASSSRSMVACHVLCSDMTVVAGRTSCYGSKLITKEINKDE